MNRFLAQVDTQFVVPVYQRNYIWNRKQCSQLLKDILAVGKNKKRHSHFIGSIVYIHDDVYSLSGIRELAIIDGQQRITTIILIYIAICSWAKQSNQQHLKQRIEETYLINKFAPEEEKLKLKAVSNNDSALKYLLHFEFYEPFPEYSPIIENFEFLQSQITAENFEVIGEGLEKLIFVEISLERGKDDPQRIFESLNSTGLDLSQADLIRNYLMMGLDGKKQFKLYRDYWQPIEQQAIEKKSNLNKVSEFIRHFLTIQNKEIPKKNKVYEDFKKKFSCNSLETIEETLQKIKKFCYHYNKILNPDREQNIEIREQLRFLQRLDTDVFHSFLLQIYEDHSAKIISQKTFVEILELIQSFIWRRFVVGLPNSALNKVFVKLFEEIDPSDYLLSIQKSLLRYGGKQRFPNNHEVINILKEKDVYNIKNKSRLYFLERLENHQNLERVPIEDNLPITIEHIFPQNPDPKWRELPEETFRNFKDIYLNTIANLTLSGNNGSLGNKTFLEKRNMNIEGKEQGYIYSRLWLNKYLASIDKWEWQEFNTRFDLIAEKFTKIWKYPEVDLEELPRCEINIFEAEDPTNKKLAYAIFFDQKINLTKISELYEYVIKKFFEWQPYTFFAVDLAKRIGLTKNKNILKQPCQISENYYIECSYNNSAKFEKMRYLLSIFDAEDDLIIKYNE